MKEALEENFPLSISQLESTIKIVLITEASDDEAREKAKIIEGMQISAFCIHGANILLKFGVIVILKT